MTGYAEVRCLYINCEGHDRYLLLENWNNGWYRETQNSS